MPSALAPVVRAEKVGIRYRHFTQRAFTLKERLVAGLQGASYEDFWALRDVNFEIHRGDNVALIGRNGAGKSTLLKAVAGVLSPTEGSLTVAGKVAPLLELGAGFKPELTGRENIYLNAAIMGLSKEQVDERLESIIEFSGLRDFIDIPIQNYSSGMKGRLGFSIATDIDPEILLADEVLAVGDTEFQRKAMNRTRQFFEAGGTVFLVTHALTTAKALCSKGLWLDGGRVRAAGSIDEVLEEYERDTRAPEPAAKRIAPRPAGLAAEAKQSVARLADEENALRGKNAALRRSIKSLEQKKALLESKVSVDQLRSEKQKAVLELHDEETVLRGRIGNLRKHVESLRKKKAELESDLPTHNTSDTQGT